MTFVKKVEKLVKRRGKQPVVVPTKEEILEQLQAHFIVCEPEDNIKKLANIISKEFERMKHTSYGELNHRRANLLGDKPQPRLDIVQYETEEDRSCFEMKHSEYSTLKVIHYKRFIITVVENAKWIRISYVKPFQYKGQA